MKLVLLKDVWKNEHKIAPNSIINIDEFGHHLIVETKDGTIVIEGTKLILENCIHNCYLP